MNRNNLPTENQGKNTYTGFQVNNRNQKQQHYSIGKIFLWIFVIIAVSYEAVVTWLYFPHLVAVGIYIIEPLIIWGCIDFINKHGRDTRTLIAILILEPLLVTGVPYGVYQAFIVPFLKLF